MNFHRPVHPVAYIPATDVTRAGHRAGYCYAGPRWSSAATAETVTTAAGQACNGAERACRPAVAGRPQHACHRAAPGYLG